MTTYPSRRFLGCLLGLVTVAVVAVAGCSPKGVKKVTIHGTVTYKGDLLRSGFLKFVGPEGSYSAAPIQPDGTFIITDVLPGEVKVAIEDAPRGSRSPVPEPKTPLRENLRDPEKSGLRYTITPDTTELPIVID
jgi:hypothetical protein